jgi:hypothetical protein
VIVVECEVPSESAPGKTLIDRADLVTHTAHHNDGGDEPFPVQELLHFDLTKGSEGVSVRR